MAVELYIEDKQVDLIGDESISIDYAVSKIGQIDKRSGGLSIQFKLPKTANNRSILGNAEDVNGLNNSIRTKLKCRLYVNGVSQNISLAVVESVNDFINVRLFDNYGDILGVLKTLKCSELDLHEYDHFWTFDNVVNYRDNTDMFVYPIIDYFSDSPNSQMNNTDRKVNPAVLFPALKYEDVLDKIISEQGYSLINLVTETVNYPTDGIIIPYVGDRNPKRNNDAKRFDGTWNIPAQTIAGIGSYLNVSFDTGVSTHGYNYYNTNNLWSGIVQKFSDSFRCDLNISITVTNTVNIPNNFFLFTNLDNQLILLAPYETKTITISGEYIFLYDTNPASTSPDLEDMFIQISCLDDIDIVSGSIGISNSSIYEISETQYETFITSGLQTRNFITLSTCLPDITQAELLKQYLLLTCSIISIDEISKTLTITPLKKIEQNTSVCIDWSDKIDITETPEHKYIADSYSKIVELKYTEDNTVIKPLGTDYSFNVYDENISQEPTIIELNYAATEATIRLIGISIPQIKMVENATGDFNTLKPRILILRYKDSSDFTNTSDLEYYDLSQSTTVNVNLPLPYFIDSDESFNLGFANNMYLYYNTFISIVQNFHSVECLIRLNELDINKLDFTRPVYIKYFNAYFYISAIKGYTPTNNESTQVELVKLF